MGDDCFSFIFTCMSRYIREIDLFSLIALILITTLRINIVIISKYYTIRKKLTYLAYNKYN